MKIKNPNLLIQGVLSMVDSGDQGSPVISRPGVHSINSFSCFKRQEAAPVQHLVYPEDIVKSQLKMQLLGKDNDLLKSYVEKIQKEEFQKAIDTKVNRVKRKETLQAAFKGPMREEMLERQVVKGSDRFNQTTSGFSSFRNPRPTREFVEPQSTIRNAQSRDQSHCDHSIILQPLPHLQPSQALRSKRRLHGSIYNLPSYSNFTSFNEMPPICSKYERNNRSPHLGSNEQRSSILNQTTGLFYQDNHEYLKPRSTAVFNMGLCTGRQQKKVHKQAPILYSNVFDSSRDYKLKQMSQIGVSKPGSRSVGTSKFLGGYGVSVQCD